MIVAHDRLVAIMKNEDFFKNLGSRIAELRQEQNLTQEQLAKTLGIKQQVLASYEVAARRPPVSLLPLLTKTLHVSVEVLIGIDDKNTKRGPKPKLQQKIEQIQNLPLKKQRLVLELLETMME